MNYLRSLFLNFLAVFFIDRMAPGIEVTSYEQVPNIGADLIFALLVGFLNASVFFFLALMEARVTRLKLAIITGAISLLAFLTISLIEFGVQVLTPIGFLIGAGFVWLVAYISNLLEWKHYRQTP